MRGALRIYTVVSADSRPLRDRQSGHFLETASLHPPLAALRRFPAPLPLIIQNIEGVFLTISGRRGRRPPTEFEGVFRAIGGPMPTSARTKELCTPYILHRQRQRRRSRDDTKFRTRPTETLLADRKGSQETIRFLAHLWVLSVRAESTPPEAWTRRFHRQPSAKT